jgi:DNA-binding transcriptional LysR family regulator
MHLGSTEAIKSYIKTGKVAGIVSRYAIREELASGIFRLIEAPDLQFDRIFYFITPRGPEPGGTSKLFIRYLQKRYNL